MNKVELIGGFIIIISFIISIISLYYTLKTKKRYEKIAMKLGNGEDITEIIKDYISKVNELDKKDDMIIEYCNKINKDALKSIKKIGFIKYNAYENCKNKLSFAIALLNNENSGIVINSIYNSENSNVYAKQIIKGTSNNTLTEEEQKAINEAINR